MADNDAVTVWIEQLAGGDRQAAQQIWDRYFHQLTELARRRMSGATRRVSDEEDAALSAMHSVCRGIEQGRFAALSSRDELWRLMVTITARKACSEERKRYAAKRGGGEVRGESVFMSADDAGIGQVLGDTPTPEFSCEVAETCQNLLAQLQDESLRQVAVWKLEGYTDEDIAVMQGCSTRTVERKVAKIRELWSKLK